MASQILKIILYRNTNDSAKTGKILDISADTEITEEEKLIPFAKKRQTL